MKINLKYNLVMRLQYSYPLVEFRILFRLMQTDGTLADSAIFNTTSH